VQKTAAVRLYCRADILFIPIP
jgi:Endopolygalacturonase